ncbi:hypothetical protein [Coralloluteibacterium thermophilus]|uniref:Uncharacterized protein n=1 Tax=Coralloluteibacterium thermophilum TaxID=2707049 RepID=A0ABV9NGE4_9GAMM
MDPAGHHEPNATLANLEAIEHGEQLPKGVVDTLVDAGLAQRDGGSPGHAVLTAKGRARLDRLRADD